MNERGDGDGTAPKHTPQHPREQEVPDCGASHPIVSQDGRNPPSPPVPTPGFSGETLPGSDPEKLCIFTPFVDIKSIPCLTFAEALGVG